MLLGTLGASLLGNMLSGKGIVREGYGNKEGKGILRAGYGSKGSSITKILHHPILEQIFKYRNIIRMSLDLMQFILETIGLKK